MLGLFSGSEPSTRSGWSQFWDPTRHVRPDPPFGKLQGGDQVGAWKISTWVEPQCQSQDQNWPKHDIVRQFSFSVGGLPVLILRYLGQDFFWSTATSTECFFLLALFLSYTLIVNSTVTSRVSSANAALTVILGATSKSEGNPHNPLNWKPKAGFEQTTVVQFNLIHHWWESHHLTVLPPDSGVHQTNSNGPNSIQFNWRIADHPSYSNSILGLQLPQSLKASKSPVRIAKHRGTQRDRPNLGLPGTAESWRTGPPVKQSVTGRAWSYSHVLLEIPKGSVPGTI